MLTMVNHINSLQMIRLSYTESLAFKKMGFKEVTDGYFVKKIPVVNCSPNDWNNEGDDYVSMLNIYQAVDFLLSKRGIYISISVHVNTETRKVELTPTVTYTRNGYVAYKNEIGNSYATMQKALYAGVKNVLETLNKL